MEIARIDIVSDENFLRKQALKREANSCTDCGATVNFEVHRQDDTVLERTKCPSCGHQHDREHILQ